MSALTLSTKILSPSSFPSFTPTAVHTAQGGGGGGGLSAAFWLLTGLFNVPFYSLWPGRGWPGLGPLAPTPPDPSRRRYQIGTVEHKPMTDLFELLLNLNLFVGLYGSNWMESSLLQCLRAYWQHQHGTRRSCQAISTRQTRTTRRTLQGR